MSMSMSKKALGTAYTSEEQEEMRLIRVEAEALKVVSSTKQIKTGLVLSPALKLYTGIVYVVATNFVIHLVEGKRHREDGGPAVVDLRGFNYYWMLDDQLSRGGNKPAVWRSDGRLDWYCAGERHREDGPCYERFVKVVHGELYMIHGKRCKLAAFELYYMMKYGKVYKVPGPYTEAYPL